MMLQQALSQKWLALSQKCSTFQRRMKMSESVAAVKPPTIDELVVAEHFKARDAQVAKTGEFFPCTGTVNASCNCPGCVGTRAGAKKRLELESPTAAAIQVATQSSAEANAALVEAVAKRVAELLSKPPAPVVGGAVPGSGAPA